MNYNKIPTIVIDDFDALSRNQTESEDASTSSLAVDPSPSPTVEEMDRLKNFINMIVPCLKTEDAAAELPPPIVVKPWEQNMAINIRANYTSRDYARNYLIHQLKLHCEQERCLNKFLFTHAHGEMLGLSALPYIKPRACAHYTPTEEEINRYYYGSGRIPMQTQVQRPYLE